MLGRSGRSMRGLSGAFGRDPGYVGALLDPSRPSRARPTPADLVAAAAATGIPVVDWLAELWAIDPVGLADELAALGVVGSLDRRLAALTPAQRVLVAQLIDALAGGERPVGQPRPKR